MCAALDQKDVAKLLYVVEDVVVSGKDLSQFVQEILRYFRNLLVCKASASRDLLALPEEEIAEMEKWANAFTLTDLIRIVEQFSELADGFDSQLAQRTALEALFIRMCKFSTEVSVDSVLEKLLSLRTGESASAGGTAEPTKVPGGTAGASSAAPSTPKKPVAKKKASEKSAEPATGSTKRTDAAAERAPSQKVNPDDRSAAMNNPYVAKVVDVFKGRIVDVKHGAPPPGSA